jgi:hypothetical protein
MAKEQSEVEVPAGQSVKITGRHAAPASTLVSVTNTSKRRRVFHDAHGGICRLEPGQSKNIEMADEHVEHYKENVGDFNDAGDFLPLLRFGDPVDENAPKSEEDEGKKASRKPRRRPRR